MIRHFIIREALNSVALEHPDDCECDTCLAANGNKDALARVYRDMQGHG